MDTRDVSRLLPLESLRFFEAAARHGSFARAASELGVTAPAVAYRVRAIEEHLDAPLFERRQRGVHLNPRGRTYLQEVQRILAELHGVSERHSRQRRRVRIVSVEAVAEKWLLPRLADLAAAHPGIAIELETNHRGVDTGSPAARPSWTAGRCSTTWAGTPTGRTGRPARTSPRRTSRGPRASASTACWSTLPTRGWGPPSGAPC